MMDLQLYILVCGSNKYSFLFVKQSIWNINFPNIVMILKLYVGVMLSHQQCHIWRYHLVKILSL